MCAVVTYVNHHAHLPEFLHLFVCVRVELLGHVLHPKQRSSVLGPRLLHSVHREPRVRDGAVPKRLHLLVQTAQRVPQSQSAECRIKLRIKVLHVALHGHVEDLSRIVYIAD